jgi:acetyl esterase/lipase
MTDFLCVAGFSAGGHLAASLGAFCGTDIVGEYRGLVRPDRLMLCYPVISSGEYTHEDSVASIAPDEKTRELVSIEKRIGDDFPPSFIWHCSDDRTVPVQNSLLLAQSLSEHGIPYELHIFPEGGHAIAMCDVTTVKDGRNERYINPHAGRWVELALEWLRL